MDSIMLKNPLFFHKTPIMMMACQQLPPPTPSIIGIIVALGICILKMKRK